MSERPILFSAPMVRAILAGTKTQTRRVVRVPAGWQLTTMFDDRGVTLSQPRPACRAGEHDLTAYKAARKPCAAGDRLWVRETWWHHKSQYLEQAGFVGGTICRLGDGASEFAANPEFDPAAYEIWRKRPSIHMPRWASRITLEVTDVRAERLQEISEVDAAAEGARHELQARDGRSFDRAMEVWCCWSKRLDRTASVASARGAFAAIWYSLNKKRPGCDWAANPWVWVITFRRLTP